VRTAQRYAVYFVCGLEKRFSSHWGKSEVDGPATRLLSVISLPRSHFKVECMHCIDRRYLLISGWSKILLRMVPTNTKVFLPSL